MNSETWKDIKNYEGLYQVSNYGNVRSLYYIKHNKYVHEIVKLKKPKLLKKGIDNSSKYEYKREQVNLIKNGKHKTFRVHRLVAEAFIPNPLNKPCINHIDNNPLNNCVDNLEWCTQKENIEWAKKQFRLKKILSFEKEKELEKDIYINSTTKELKEKYNISNAYLSRFKKERKIKKSIPRKYNINLDEMIKMIKEGIPNSIIAKHFNCTNNLVARRKYQLKKGEIK